MALVKKSSNSTRAIVILIAGIAVAAAGYFLFQRFANPTLDNSNVLQQANRQVITEFGESILEDKRYKSLHSFGQSVTVDLETEGHNANPFE